jgi:phosphocarrier protein FPr
MEQKMIGLVIVSHSAKLAEGVCELATQMTQGQVPLAAAGGIDDPENPIGTDAFRIQQAIETVYSEDGVIVLMDMGSALLSAEMALEFLSEAQRANVHLCEAPLVEGAVAAAVQAIATADIKQVLAEARSALQAKTNQLHASQPAVLSGTTGTVPSSTLSLLYAEEIVLTIRTQHGLHARPAAQFVGTAGRFQADITVRNVSQNTAPVNAKSINQVTTLGARRGHEIALAAQGVDAAAALAALQALVESNFGEPDTLAETPPLPSSPVAPVPQAANGKWAGIPASPG